MGKIVKCQPKDLKEYMKVKWKWKLLSHVWLNSLQPHDFSGPEYPEYWVAIPFSRGSYQPRDQSQVSHIVGGSFTSWATREAPK